MVVGENIVVLSFLFRALGQGNQASSRFFASRMGGIQFPVSSPFS
ncbi:hypothetical protein D1BOALGB6SA_10161 [Olavius sp. associated proteobacterium Delta 1]|nr:hypothetical protein D1BOALGB6SA_10161 [Olavius sp. associated proteobacterium Delta 1]